jgi:hypothetical protein
MLFFAPFELFLAPLREMQSADLSFHAKAQNNTEGAKKTYFFQ